MLWWVGRINWRWCIWWKWFLKWNAFLGENVLCHSLLCLSSGPKACPLWQNVTIFYSIKVEKNFFQIEFKLFRILQFNSAHQIKRLGSEMEEISQRNTTDVLRKIVYSHFTALLGCFLVSLCVWVVKLLSNLGCFYLKLCWRFIWYNVMV